MKTVHHLYYLAGIIYRIHSVVAYDYTLGTLKSSLVDVVGAENFSYYTYSDREPVLLVLTSLSGNSLG